MSQDCTLRRGRYNSPVYKSVLKKEKKILNYLTSELFLVGLVREDHPAYDPHDGPLRGGHRGRAVREHLRSGRRRPVPRQDRNHHHLQERPQHEGTSSIFQPKTNQI